MDPQSYPDEQTQLEDSQQRDYRRARRASLTASWSETVLNSHSHSHHHSYSNSNSNSQDMDAALSQDWAAPAVRRTQSKVPTSPLPPPPLTALTSLSPLVGSGQIAPEQVKTPSPAVLHDTGPQNPVEATFEVQDDSPLMIAASGISGALGPEHPPQPVHHAGLRHSTASTLPRPVPPPPLPQRAKSHSHQTTPGSMTTSSSSSNTHSNSSSATGLASDPWAGRSADRSDPGLLAAEEYMYARATSSPPDPVRSIAIQDAHANPASKSFSNRILNFRDLGASVIKLASQLHTDRTHAETKGPLPGVVFRSAELGSACEQDVRTLFSRYGIRTIIDLRSELEARASDIMMRHYPASIQPTADQSMERLMKLRAAQVRKTIIEVAAHDYETAAKPWEKTGESQTSWSHRNSLRYNRSIGDPRKDALARALVHLYDDEDLNTGGLTTQRVSIDNPYVPQHTPPVDAIQADQPETDNQPLPGLELNSEAAPEAQVALTRPDIHTNTNTDMGTGADADTDADGATLYAAGASVTTDAEAEAKSQSRIEEDPAAMQHPIHTGFAQSALDWGNDTLQSLRSYWDQQWLPSAPGVSTVSGKPSTPAPTKAGYEQSAPARESAEPSTAATPRRSSAGSESSIDAFYHNRPTDANRDPTTPCGLKPVKAMQISSENPLITVSDPNGSELCSGDESTLPNHATYNGKQKQHLSGAGSSPHSTDAPSSASRTPESPISPTSAGSPVGPVVTNKFDGSRRRYRCNVIGENYRKKCVWANTPWSTRIKVILRFATFNKAEAIRTIGREVLAPRGLAGSYEDYVDYCKEEFAAVMRIFADPAAYPILFHCQHGKDRTGIVAMLLLGILGVEDDVIAADYALSQQNLVSVRERMELLDMGAVGLPPSFCDAPAPVMRNLLRHIRANYGSIRGYLRSAGLKDQEINTIAWCLRGNFCGIARAKSKQAHSDARKIYLRPTAAHSDIFDHLSPSPPSPSPPRLPPRNTESRSHSVDDTNNANFRNRSATSAGGGHTGATTTAFPRFY
ncbi:hypothetical protein GGI07_003901 [Coemansia sp. Benny D115]|nr:hypothetical protein GGI07_003901 [Coemansia sp. Benny D115]